MQNVVADSFYQGQVTFTCFSKQPVNAYGPDSAEKLSSLNIPVNTLGLLEHTITHRGDYSLVIRRLDLLVSVQATI